jgi:hypothetical protein
MTIALEISGPMSCTEVSGAPEDVTWRCFHCNDVFTDRDEAEAHFGIDEMALPACKLSALEGGLVKMLRDQEEELRRFRMDDTASCREFYALGAEHVRQMRREEEKGYASGVKDGTDQAMASLKAHADLIRDILVAFSPDVVNARSGLPSGGPRQAIPLDALGKLWDVVKEMDADASGNPASNERLRVA